MANDTKKIGAVALTAIVIIAAIFIFYDRGPDQDLTEALGENTEFSDLFDALESTGILEGLAGSEYTILAPTDGAFDDYDTELYGDLLEDTDSLGALLNYHIIEGKYSVADISKMSTVTTLQGEVISISTTGNVTVNDVEISQSEEIECENGYIIPVGEILLPPTIESTYIDLTITDAAGREVYIKKVPERIVSIASSATETLYAINAGDLLVGRDKYSVYPEEANDLPDLGSGSSLALEETLNLNPDLVITWYYSTSAIESLEQNGITVLAIGPSSVQDVLDLITLFGQICDHEADAQAIVQDMQTTIDEISSYAESLSEDEKVKVFYELSTAFKSVSDQTFTGELIELAGGINIAADQEATYPQMSSEWIIDQNPDVVVVVSYGATTDEIKSRDGWDSIDAVLNDKVYSIESNWVSSTPRMVLGLEQFAKWFYPEHFA
ncbi:MAG TPA: helical backbone metal receptor [Candidatus Methanofastidiosa archaeon]|nr:helical backbone metal receptor [Candidatus Methanofastidiosa archaeon]HPR41250.1 helical backbone metal receptor [Candidatus Methanofastidiosa archaeon]